MVKNATTRNKLSHLEGCVLADLDSDILVSIDQSTPAFSYYYGGGISEFDTSNPKKPICFTEAKVADRYSFGASSSCPNMTTTNQDLQDLLAEKDSSSEILQDVHNIYYGNVDKGDIKALEDFINDPNNTSMEVRNEMIACIPYVSDNAYRTAFTRTPALNPWHLAQVLLMNSPLKQSVINMMTYYDLDPFYRELVLDGQNGRLTTMMILEADMNQLSLEVENARQDYIRLMSLYEEEVNYNASKDFLSEQGNTSSKILCSSMSFTQGLYPESAAFLNECPSNNTRCVILGILLNAAENGSECPRFSPTALMELENIANDNSTTGFSMARAVLRSLHDNDIEIDLRYVDPNKRLERDVPINYTAGKIGVYPNPATDIIYVSIQVPEGVEATRLELINPLGQLVPDFFSNFGSRLQEVDVSSLQSGIYLCNLYFDDILVETTKINVVH